jgi:SAM-dependent methyltransferase
MSQARTFSTGYDRSRLQNYLALFRHHRRTRTATARIEFERFQQGRDVFERYGHKPVRDSTILEVGCGQRFAATLLFHSLGAKAVGIDMDEVSRSFSPRAFRAIWRRNGFERAAKTLIRLLLFDTQFYRELSRIFGGRLLKETVDLRVMDARAMQFPDASFDYLYSVAVFEHIDNIDRATQEMARVLRPGGIAYIGVHLFPSVSGGHHFEWSDPNNRPSRTVPPWDHLRKNLYPSQAYLNKLREHDYIETFAKYLTIIEVRSKYEGEALLTDPLRQELADYGREDLLKNSIFVVLTKQPGRPVEHR